MKPLLAFAASLTLAQWNQILGCISFAATIAYTLWKWQKESKK